MDIDAIHRESFGSLEPIKSLDWGVLCNNKVHNKENVVKITTNPNEIEKLYERGWRVHPGESKYLLRAPETTLCDLSNPQKNYVTNPKALLSYYRYLDRSDIPGLINNILSESGKEVKAIETAGDSVEAEKRIIGSSGQIQWIATQLWERYLDQTASSVSPDASGSAFESTINNHSVVNADSQTRCQYQRIADFYETICNTDIPDQLMTGFWDDVPDNDVYVFIAKAAIRYFLGFRETHPDREAMVWEHHASSVGTKEVRLFDTPVTNKSVAVIDKCYTGRTIASLGEKIEAKGGDPDLIGMFPKSVEGVDRMDQIFFIDQFYDTDNIDTDAAWHLKLFADRFKLDQYW